MPLPDPQPLPPALRTCPRCGHYNAIVNECRCDPANLPTLLPAEDILVAAAEKYSSLWNAESRLSVATSFIDSLPEADRLRFASHALETSYAEFLSWQEDFLRWEQRDTEQWQPAAQTDDYP